MAKTKNAGSLFDAPGFSFNNATGVLSIKHGGKIEITEDATTHGWTYEQGDKVYSLSAADVNKITTIEAVNKGTHIKLNAETLKGDTFNFSGKGEVEITGVTYAQANVTADHKFDPNVNVDTIIAGALGPSHVDVCNAFNVLSDMFGGPESAIRLLWDYVDDNYSYYNTAINAVGVGTGLIYAEYLRHGGHALTDVVKFTPDGPDAGTTPDRLQTIHDNLLGNLHIPSIVDKFFDGNPANGLAVVPGYTGPVNGSNATPDEAKGQFLLDIIAEVGLVGRPIYSGNEGDPNAGAAHAFDVAHGLT